jgi:hypothetical protein
MLRRGDSRASHDSGTEQRRDEDFSYRHIRLLRDTIALDVPCSGHKISVLLRSDRVSCAGSARNSSRHRGFFPLMRNVRRLDASYR